MKTKEKTTEFEAELRKWAWREAIEVLQRAEKPVTFSETMSVANELAEFVLVGTIPS